MIRVPYKCTCMQDEAVVEVSPRRADRDIVDWVEEVVVAAVTQDHRKRSPLCVATTMEYVKIPAPENAPHIGGEPTLNS